MSFRELFERLRAGILVTDEHLDEAEELRDLLSKIVGREILEAYDVPDEVKDIVWDNCKRVFLEETNIYPDMDGAIVVYYCPGYGYIGINEGGTTYGGGDYWFVAKAFRPGEEREIVEWVKREIEDWIETSRIHAEMVEEDPIAYREAKSILRNLRIKLETAPRELERVLMGRSR